MVIFEREEAVPEQAKSDCFEAAYRKNFARALIAHYRLNSRSSHTKPRANGRASSCRSSVGRERPEVHDLLLCPLNSFSLGFEGRKGMVRVIFDDVIIDVAAVWPPFRSCFDLNIRHRFLLFPLPHSPYAKAARRAAEAATTEGPPEDDGQGRPGSWGGAGIDVSNGRIHWVDMDQGAGQARSDTLRMDWQPIESKS